jgi:hypothetical protein
MDTVVCVHPTQRRGYPPWGCLHSDPTPGKAQYHLEFLEHVRVMLAKLI